MITFNASSAHCGLRQLENLRTVHPTDSRYSVFVLSCASFLGWLWCQLPPSTSIANFRSGIARSILNISTANCGIQAMPLFAKRAFRIVSYLLITLLFITLRAVFIRLSRVCSLNATVDRLASLILRRSSYDHRSISNAFASDGERVGIEYLRRSRHIVGTEQENNRAMAGELLRSLIYNKSSSSFVGRVKDFILSVYPHHGTLSIFGPTISGGA